MRDVYCHDDVKGKCVISVVMMMLGVSAMFIVSSVACFHDVQC